MNRGILIVEDDPMTGKALRRLLEMRGYHPQLVTCVHRGIEVVQQREAAFHCALLDLYLPDGDGTEVLAELQMRMPETITAVLTGMTNERLTKAESMQPDIILHKPCRMDHVLSVVTGIKNQLLLAV